jgi:hypothetical protein
MNITKSLGLHTSIDPPEVAILLQKFTIIKYRLQITKLGLRKGLLSIPMGTFCLVTYSDGEEEQ